MMRIMVSIFFIIEGTVNINNNQLSKRDGIRLWNVKSVEINAEMDSEILIMEIPMNKINDGYVFVMKKKYFDQDNEEFLNFVSHGIALIISFIGLFFLIEKF